MSHKIQRQVLALEIPSGGDSWRFQNELRDTFNQQVLPRLEKACDDMGIGEDTILKIDSLLLDTGEISAQGMSAEWAAAIEYQFREQILRIKRKGPSKSEKVEVQTNEQSELNRLLHFLNLGVLPWWAEGKSASSLQHVFAELLKDEPHALTAGIKRLPNKSLAVYRVIGLLSDDVLQEFKKALGIHQPLGKVIFQALKRLKIKVYKEAIYRLDALEITKALTGETVTASALLYEWFRQELKQSLAKETIAQSIYKHLYTNNLKLKSKSIVESNTLKDINTAIDRLVEEKLLEPGPSKSRHKTNPIPSERQDYNSATDREKDNVSPKKARLADARDELLKSKPGQAETSKKNATDTGVHADSDQSQYPHPPDASSTGPERVQQRRPEAEEAKANPDTPPPQADKPANNQEASPVKAQPSVPGSEDEHVLKQLERIRKEAIARQAEAEGKGKGQAESTIAGQIDPSARLSYPAADSGSELGNDTQEISSLDQKTNQEKGKADEAETLPSHAGKTDRASYPFAGQLREAVEECYVENAGLVLFWPFLSRFFKNMGFMENGTFKSLEHQEQAAIALQYLLGEAPELQEFSLPLNKLLCALPIEHPLTSELKLDKAQKEHCKDLLQSTITNWDSLRGTSIPGFQGSFLNRQGVLKKQENGWLLQVEKMAFDMLLEKLPWPVSIVKLTWMEQPIYVEW